MKKDFAIENVGNVTINYNSWSGNFNVYLDGKAVKKVGKKVFVLENIGENNKQERLVIDGNIFNGISFFLLNTRYNVSPKLPWHGYLLCLIPFIMVLVLGNISYFAEQGFYFVGGAIGGAIGGVFTVISIYCYAAFSKWYFKVLVAILMIVLTFLACWGIGSAIVASLA